jgi:hypothetical protein
LRDDLLIPPVINSAKRTSIPDSSATLGKSVNATWKYGL